MSKFDLALPQPLHQWWHWLWVRYYFKFVLPKIEIADIDGIRLDLKSFSLKVRNRVLRGYEVAEKKMCQEFLNADDSVLEIGGGIGFIGLFCQKKIGIKNYTIVEANPHTIEFLQRNYALNGLTPNVFNLALAKTSGSALLNVAGDFWENFVSRVRQPGSETVPVPALTFSELLDQTGRDFDALIIDIEGAERFINFAEIPGRVKKIIIELHPTIIGERKVSGIINQLSARKFQIACEEENTLVFLKTD